MNGRKESIIGGDPGKVDAKDLLVPQLAVRRIDLERDTEAIAAIATIYSQTSVVEHLCGFAPGNIGINDGNIIEYLPGDIFGGISREEVERIAGDLVIATPDGVLKYFKKMGNNAEVYVAESDGRVVGTAVLGKRITDRLLCCSLGKIAVSDDAPKISDSSSRGKGIAEKLLGAMDERIGNLGYNNIAFDVIKDIVGTETALNFYRKHGYSIVNETPNADIAWDISTGRFTYRDVYNLQKHRGPL